MMTQIQDRVIFEVAMSLNDGRALVIARVDDLSALYIVHADENETDGYSDNLSDTDSLPDDEQWPEPPQAMIDEARALAVGTAE